MVRVIEEVPNLKYGLAAKFRSLYQQRALLAGGDIK